ncbi:MAG TPA: C2H2-type zinc finger protein [Nitrososphaeraceae archaeon]
MEHIVINFAGDVLLAQAVKNYLTSQMGVSTIYMIPETDELSISFEQNNKRNGMKIIKEILRNYLDSNNLARYQIMQLENILTVGIPKRIEEISSLIMCEICGWRLNTEEELLVHRRIHWI